MKLKEICSVNQGLQIPISQRYQENGINRYFYITIQFLKDSISNRVYIENPPKSTICYEDDILVTRTGSTGKIITGIKGCFHNNFFKITYDKQKVDGRYLYHCLTSKEKQYEMKMRSGITTIPDLNHFMFLDMKIPFFTLDIQKRISKILDSIIKKIELNNKINQNLEAMAKTLYDYWFVQFDFPDKNGKPYKSSGGKMVYSEELKSEIPEGWEVKDLSELIKIDRGISYKSSDITDDGVPLINLNSFHLDGTYKHEGIKYFSSNYNENKIVEANDLLIATTDVTRNADIIGKATLIPDIFENDILMSCDIARIIPTNKIDKYYLEMLFNSDYYHNYIKGFASGTLVLHLNINGIGWFKSIIPTTDLLNKFSDLKKNIGKKKNIILKENQKLTQLRDWLLPMLMNGQVKVK